MSLIGIPFLLIFSARHSTARMSLPSDSVSILIFANVDSSLQILFSKQHFLGSLPFPLPNCQDEAVQTLIIQDF